MSLSGTPWKRAIRCGHGRFTAVCCRCSTWRSRTAFLFARTWQFKCMLLGQNPCNVDMIFRAIKRFGNWGREGGGVSGIEIALWDLIGKVYGVPCYQFLGGKYRDRVRIYADTPTPGEPTPEDTSSACRAVKTQGLTFIKFDVGPQPVRNRRQPLIGQDTPHEAVRHGQVVKAPMAGRASS